MRPCVWQRRRGAPAMAWGDAIANAIISHYGQDSGSSGATQLVPRQPPFNPRCFTPRECARLQGFPHDFQVRHRSADQHARTHACMDRGAPQSACRAHLTWRGLTAANPSWCLLLPAGKACGRLHGGRRGGGGGGESFPRRPRVYWGAVPQALRARRANRDAKMDPPPPHGGGGAGPGRCTGWWATRSCPR
jgi:hypothetical protein